MDNENDPFELITVDGASNEVNEIAASLRSVTLDLEDAIDDDNSRIKENIEENKTENEVQNKNVGDAIDNDKFESLKQRVDSLESPFIWNLKRETQVDIISKTIEKMKEVKDDDMFQWRHFTLSLILCFEYYRQGEISTAWEKLCECEKTINSIDSKGMYEEFYQSTMDALLHVVLASKCHLLIKEGKLSELEGVLEKIVKADNMDQSCRAALCGIKAAVSMEYGHEGTKNAFDYAKKASELEESEAEWHFLIGKCHGRIRRVEYYNEIPKPEELKSLERAVQLRESPSYIIFLAQSYRETGFRVYSHNKQEVDQALRTKIDAMNKRSEELYRKALKLRPTCAHVNVRCAQGFLKLSHPYKNITKAKECALKAEELAPQNAMTSHVLGNIYEGERNYEKAREYYTNSGKQGAYGAQQKGMPRVRYTLEQSRFVYDTYMRKKSIKKCRHKKINPRRTVLTEEKLDDIAYLLENSSNKSLSKLVQQAETPRHEETLCQLGSYYFFIKNDLVTAYTKYWGKEFPNLSPSGEAVDEAAEAEVPGGAGEEETPEAGTPAKKVEEASIAANLKAVILATTADSLKNGAAGPIGEAENLDAKLQETALKNEITDLTGGAVGIMARAVGTLASTAVMENVAVREGIGK
ncbi:hypothetical protein C0J52_01137 [Blattella germanica]|nr:hypothetical protein C0J52_01137 [Blattella germanica]